MGNYVSFQIDEIDFPRCGAKIQSGNRHGQTKAAGTGASRIDIEYAGALGATRPVRMSADHHLMPSRRRVEGQILNIVENVEGSPSRLGYRSSRQVRHPRILVHIAFHSHYRGDRAKRIENFELADVPRVDDEVRSLKSTHGFVSQKPVSV